MCSANCARQPVSDSEREALTPAVVSVAERSFFAFAELAQADGLEPPRCYTATVAFRGPTDGDVRVWIPELLARELCTNFLGCEADTEIEESALRDLIGEFANMACGTWLTGLTRASCFSLAPPIVDVAARGGAAGAVTFSVNGQPLWVRLEVADSQERT